MKFNGAEILRIKHNGVDILKSLQNGQFLYTGKIIVLDGFNRANNNTSLGVSETGQAWQVLQGAWGIASNTAMSLTTTGFARVVIESGSSNCIISCTLSANYDGATRLIFRCTDANNEYVFNSSAGTYVLGKRVNGTYSIRGTYLYTPVNGDIIKVVLTDSNIKVYLNNNILMFNVTDTFNQNATKHGLCSYNSNLPRWDDYRVEAL